MGNQQGKLQRHQQSGGPKKSVHWKTAECPASPGRPALIALPDQQPDVICLRWERPKLDGGSPITGYTVEHRRVGSPHWVRATPTPIPRCEVSISGLEPGWRYQFRVFAENVVGRSAPSDLSDVLTVTLQRNAICVPRFVAELQDFHAVEDERVEFRVRFLGHPPPEINWFKDGYEIFSSRRTKIVNDNEASVLIIHQVALTDEGEIKCTATNRAGHVVTKARLLVQAPPKIRLPRTYEDGLIVEAEEVLRLKVGIAGQPPPLVTWIHENEIISHGGRFEIITSERNSMLKIDNVQRDDRGEYSVKAGNNLGEDIASFLVTITARPNPPGKVCLIMSFGKSATLSWTAPLDDGGCKIGNYILEYFRVGWNVWLKAATTRSLNTTLNDLIEGSEYKFRVKAENPYGVSEPSEESDVLFIPDPRRGIIKPKSAELKSEEKPVSPRRKTLSPPARLVADAATETAAIRFSPKVTRKYKPQLLDTEALHREMSYGTSDIVLKQDIRKSPSPFLNQRQQQKAETLKTPEPLRKDENKSPQRSPIRDLMKISLDTVGKDNKPLPNNNINKSAEEPKSPPQSPNTNNNKKPFFLQNLLKGKETVAIATKQTTPPLTTELKNHTGANEVNNVSKSSTVEDIRSTLALERSAEPFKLSDDEQVKHFPNNTLNSMCKLPNLSIAIATSRLGETLATEVIEQTTVTTETNGNFNSNGTENCLPTIEITTPTRSTVMPVILETTPLSTSSTLPPIPSSFTSHTDHHDEVHTSNEFMVVVFDKNRKVKDKDKQDSFELDLEDAIQSPPISMSAPDLALLEYTALHPNFPIRRSVSSTELLYERAMARFYEAVELEEAEKARKLKMAQDKLSIQPASVRKRLGSITEAERLSFEKRSELRRQSADIMQTIKRWTSKENVGDTKALTRTTAMVLTTTEQCSFESHEEYQEEDFMRKGSMSREDSFELGSDYTESTASSDEDSIEKFKIELMARTHSPPSGELETYHPRNMSAGTFTPYRAPTPDEAALVLTRPVPLPSPDFVPKPILKKRSNENITSPASSDNEGATSSNKMNHSSNEKLDITKSIKSFFKRDAQRSTTARNTEENEIISNQQEKANGDPLLMEATRKRKAKEEEEQRKRLEAERIMKEEARAAADHYSELVRQVSTTKKYHTPIYMDQEELKKVNEKATKEDPTEKKEVKREESLEIKTNTMQETNNAKSTISETPQLTNKRSTVSNTAWEIKLMKTPSKMNAIQQQQKVEEKAPVNSLPEQETVEISSTVVSETVEERPDSRGRPRLVKVKRVLKKRIPTRSQSREASSSRPPSSQDDVSRTKRSTTTESISPGPLGRQPLPSTPPDFSTKTNEHNMLQPATKEQEKTVEELTLEAHENVRSALNYSTDFILFVVACYVYLFKDARLVLPILGLMIYRQLGEAIVRCIPSWLRRRK